MLESQGVPVVGFGTDEFPAFYHRSSGLEVLARADRPDEVARIMRAHWDLGLESGLLIANPIPELVSIADERLEHQAAQIKNGQSPDNFLSPSDLSDFQRSHLRDAFVVIRSMQSALGHGRAAPG